jgi:hypothetical protein
MSMANGSNPPNPAYVLAPSLQEFFIDKNTNLPLTNGLVFFYEDNNRNVLKPVFELQGDNIGGYTFLQLPNPIILSGAGTIQDNNGNDILPYYFPYDAMGNIQLYYIIVTDQFGSPQFTRSAFPGNSFVEAIIPSLNASQNIIPNGQFLLHNNHIPVPYPTSGSPNNFTYPTSSPYTTNVVPVAPGGWTFERTSTSTATDTITFQQYVSPLTTPPSANPRYTIDINRSVGSADAECDLRIKFMDVNTFSSSAPAPYTLIFVANNTGPSVTFNVDFIQYYGTGGSPSTATDMNFAGPFVINSGTFTVFAASGIIPEASGTVGTNDDDFIQFAIRFATGSSTTFNVQITDVILLPGTFTQAQAQTISFPLTTTGQMTLAALSNIAPVPTTFGSPLSSTTNDYFQEDGSNLFLPIIMTTEGFSYDVSQIGTIVGKMTPSAVNNELLCDGTQYSVIGYSNIGIPYKRLFNAIFNTTINISSFGNGATFSNALIEAGSTANIMLFANNNGVLASPSAGSINPTFTYKNLFTAPAAGINYTGYSNNIGNVVAISNFTTGTHNAHPAASGTSTMTVVSLSNFNAGGNLYAFEIAAIPASSLAQPSAPGLYFTFSNATIDYYMWFQITNETDPAPGGTGIKVNLDAAMGAGDVSDVIANAISQYQSDLITTVAASAITDGASFIFHTNGVTPTTYTVYYSKSASTPVPTQNPIKVTLTGSETAAQVASKTQIAINSQFFAVPNLLGQFLRGNDPTQIYDFGFRYSLAYDLPITAPGTQEFYSNAQHNHTVKTVNNATVGATTTIVAGSNTFTADTLATDFLAFAPESRPVNTAVNWYIKY